MKDRFRQLLGIASNDEKNNGTLLNSLEKHLAKLSEEKIHFLTGLSGLMGRVAYSDFDLSVDELNRAGGILTEFGGIDAAEARIVVELIKECVVELGGIEDHRYSRLINDFSDRETKVKIIDCLFRIAAADNIVSSEEDHVIGLVARELLIDREEFIRIRTKFSELRSVLKETD